MLKYLTIVIIFFIGILIFGCSKDCPQCPEENKTDVDPPFIQSISSPGQITVGSSANFSCLIKSDAPITRKSWNLFAETGANANILYPSGTVNGPWNPGIDQPEFFVQTDTGANVSRVYNKRGIYNILLEIKDADNYIERGGTRLFVKPTRPDTSANPMLIVADNDFHEVPGRNFEFLYFSLAGDNAYPASVYADTFNIFKAFAHLNCDDGQPKTLQSRIETSKYIQIEGVGGYYGVFRVNFDIYGTMHLWSTSHDDFIRFSVYMMLRETLPTYGLPVKRYLYSQTIFGNDVESAYSFNANHMVEDTIMIEGMFEYELTFGVEIVQYLAGDDSTGSAICFDGTRGMTKLNGIFVKLDK